MKESTLMQRVIEGMKLSFLELEKEERSRRIKMGFERRKYDKQKNNQQK